MGNLRMNADQISYKGGEKPMSVEEAIKNAGNTGLAHTADIAPDFSTESAYSAGDYVYHNGTLYVFTADHAAGAWSTSDTQAVTVGGELADVKSGLIGEIVAVGTGVSLYRQGAMRILKLYGAESDSIGVISELSAFDRPLVQVLNPCVYNDGTTKNGYIIVEATGEIKLLDVTTDTAVSGGRAFSMVSYYII